MKYREINNAIGILSAIICVVLLLYQLMKRKKTKSEKWFTGLIISNIGMISGDVVECTISGMEGKLVFALLTIFTLIIYYISSGMLMLSMNGWITSYIGQRKKVPSWFKILNYVLIGIHCILAITMPWNRNCYIDEMNYYHRGDTFFLAIMFTYIVYLMTIVFMIINVKQFKKKEFILMGSFVVLPMVAEIIQVIFPDFLIVNVGVAVGLVALMLFIQFQREQDKDAELKNVIIEENKKLEALYDKQENLNAQLIDVVCGAVEAKDIYTRGHSLRVAQYAREIMYRLGGDEKAQQEVYYIGILHDVGKIRVKDEIINKKGRLTDDEYEEIKLHTIAGYQILKDVDIIPDLAIGARWHHERYDGSGYPNGLAGENIPLIARIISVADAYDAMTSNRSYHSVMSQADVREQIVKGMGTQFDPKIAQIMLDMMDDDINYDMKQINSNHITSILMIDDDPFMHTLVDQILSTENYVLTFASSAKEGIELLKENKYDLCLLDKEMPEMNGLEVLEWIHNNIRKLRVILLTGDKDMATIKKSEMLGAMDYITKPIKVRILKESISSVLKH